MANQTVRRRVTMQGFQPKFILIQLALVVAGMLVLAAILLRPVLSSVPQEGAGAEAARDQVALFHVIVWSAFVAVMALLSGLFIRMSHRVAGSLYRFQDAFQQIADGKLDFHVVTRKGDYLAPERDDLNGMIASLRARIQDAQSAVTEIDRLVADKRASGGTLSTGDLEALQGRISRASAALARFTVGPRA